MELEDGRIFTMAMYDSWSHKEQRAFVADFFIARWDALSPHEKSQACTSAQVPVLKQPQEAAAMTQRCHICGRTGMSSPAFFKSPRLIISTFRPLSPDAYVGYTQLFCSNCAMRSMLFPQVSLVRIRWCNFYIYFTEEEEERSYLSEESEEEEESEMTSRN